MHLCFRVDSFLGANLALGVGLGFAAIFAALGSLVLMTWLQSAEQGRKPSIFSDSDGRTLFLFDGETLIDSTPGGRAVISASPAPGSAFAKLKAHLAPFFPTVDRYLDQLPDIGMITLEGEDAEGIAMVLRAELRGGLLRVELAEAAFLRPSRRVDDPLAHRALTEEVETLRSMMTQAPIIAWREREDGEVVWANTRYVLMAAESLGSDEELSWPLPRLFDRVASLQGAGGQRQKLLCRDGTTMWFDIAVFPERDQRRIYAIPCDSAVAAETNLRDIMQTLTKTFAHLTLGIAIFDSKRQLQMFNPALLDLTGLPPDFLASRPTILAMLDAMRNRNMVPEPKDYHRWRRQLTELDGTTNEVYDEVWSLAGDQTYRVIGRPQNNGALALMFEDISGEILRSRRYRADLELGQSVVDSLTESVAVFSETGHLVMTNRAYGELWGDDPSQSVIDIGIRNAAKFWSEQCAPSPVWHEMETFVATVGDRESWLAEARMLDGRALRCRLQPLEGGATLISFNIETGREAASDEVLRINRRRA